MTVVRYTQAIAQRERDRQAQFRKDECRRRARERAEAQQRARQAAKEELRSIVKAWNDVFALEAFFTELSHRAMALDGDERANLEARIQTARELTGGPDALDRFMKWKPPPCGPPHDELAVSDESGDDSDDEYD